MEDNIKETILLLKFMIKHNDAHILELKNLMSRFDNLDDNIESIFNDSIKDFNEGNKKLESILNIIEGKNK